MTPLADLSRPAGIRNSLLRTLHDYWRAKLNGRGMPSRGDIDPVEIPPTVLPHVILTDIMDGPRFRFRLAGTAIRAAAGMEITGRYLDELFSGRYSDYIVGIYRELIEVQRPIYTESAYVSLGRAEQSTQRIMMPLSEDGSSVNMVLSGQVFEQLHVSSPAASMLRSDDFREAVRIVL